mmetsp:Transcript_72796/g.152047  ORF Transcript_72796/g.152047 Transcript_72796/m.152047 type:complete len:227 (-) Transcript_72796:534-1214(-)
MRRTGRAWSGRRSSLCCHVQGQNIDITDCSRQDDARCTALVTNFPLLLSAASETVAALEHSGCWRSRSTVLKARSMAKQHQQSRNRRLLETHRCHTPSSCAHLPPRPLPFPSLITPLAGRRLPRWPWDELGCASMACGKRHVGPWVRKTRVASSHSWDRTPVGRTRSRTAHRHQSEGCRGTAPARCDQSLPACHSKTSGISRGAARSKSPAAQHMAQATPPTPPRD